MSYQLNVWGPKFMFVCEFVDTTHNRICRIVWSGSEFVRINLASVSVAGNQVGESAASINSDFKPIQRLQLLYVVYYMCIEASSF